MSKRPAGDHFSLLQIEQFQYLVLDKKRSIFKVQSSHDVMLCGGPSSKISYEQIQKMPPLVAVASFHQFHSLVLDIQTAIIIQTQPLFS